jgi:hypothetical protein
MPHPSGDPKKHPEWIMRVLPFVFSIAGLALLANGSQELIQGYSSNTWRTTEGEVIESRLSRAGSGKKGYRPVIVYTYNIESMQFFSDRIHFGMSSYRTPFKTGRQISTEWVEKYPEGSRVSVKYDPIVLGQSTLNAGIHITAWVAPVMGVPFLIVGLLMFRKRPSCK